MSAPHPSSAAAPDSLQALFDLQRAAVLTEGVPSALTRRDRLSRAVDMLVSSQKQLCEALSHDFGQRPVEISRFLDILPAVHSLKLARRRLPRWMRPRRSTLGLPLGVPGAIGHIIHQPLGVVGVISPWNFPITLTFGPLAGIFSAGNRCLVKPSELTPATSGLMRTLVAQYFDPRELAVVTGGQDVAEAFSRLPFDHLLFTGSGTVGRRVMLAAAEHLVPVTLELGGKCPVVVGRSASLSQAVDRILLAKMANAGQICLAPDYVCLPRESIKDFVRYARLWAARVYPGLPANSDYTSIVSPRHAKRAEELIADATAKGATVIRLTDEPATRSTDQRLISPAIVIDATDTMKIMQEEIFAPLLPVRAYDRIDEAIGYISGHAHPLALYYFGNDGAEKRELLARTTSGGVTVNDIGMHFFAEALPFGGIGASGLGAYHGEHGFRRFSHARSVLQMPRWDFAGLLGLRPPYTRRLKFWLDLLIRR
jgi:coniferyl-aldehyde dehydrogenase